jgi:CelD/BcsL family acetyltransferase involved in cellulose biosynthesis
MKIIIKEKFDNELMEKWEELEKDSVITFFQTYYCNNSWFKNIEHKNNFKLQIVICEYHSKLFAIFPFILKKKFNLTTLEWAGQNLFDYNGPIFRKNFDLDKENFIKLWNDILASINKFDLIFLKNQIDDQDYIYNPIIKYIKCKYQNKSFGIKKNNFPNQLTDNKNYNRIKNIKKLGSVEFKVAENTTDKLAIIDQTINNKIFDNKISIQNDLKITRMFYMKLIEKKNLHCSAVYLNQRIIASHFGIIDNDRFVYLVPSYLKDKKIKKYSPGKILLNNLINFFFNSNLKYFDFAAGDEIYKIKFSNHENRIFYYIAANTIGGYFLLFLRRIKNNLL